MCGGMVVANVEREVAPGYENFIGKCPMVESTSYYCASCGISYRFPPSRAKKLSKAHGVEVVLTDEMRKKLGLEDS